ncbi:MAG: ATP synthase subunit I [Thermodesulfobacteriota bacterium]|nr:ATP synthase subunit I [Thermodesulfobacteriota bacterium]
MTEMNKVREAQKKYCSRALMTAIVACFFMIAADHVPWGKGLILGTLFSVVNFILIGESIPGRLGRSPKKSVFISMKSIVIRYALLAVPLVIAIKVDTFNFASVCVGLFSVQLLLLSDHILQLIFSLRQRQV